MQALGESDSELTDAPRPGAWYYAENGAQRGPATDEQIKVLIELGHLGAGDLVWRDDLTEWTPAVQTALARFFPAEARPALDAYVVAASPAASPAERIAAPPMRRTRGGRFGRVLWWVLRALFVVFQIMTGVLTLCVIAFLVMLFLLAGAYRDAPLHELMSRAFRDLFPFLL